ncbi:protein of unknown function [Methylorubrum extorquens]|uniref:Uncharacterized protein n=1 Tax=Methylorubrum extorquens TaxID=408 RepID=A0A2N9AIS9_METEX|nr:protein of unknown function [Methylorubrum extorquens]
MLTPGGEERGGPAPCIFDAVGGTGGIMGGEPVAEQPFSGAIGRFRAHSTRGDRGGPPSTAHRSGRHNFGTIRPYARVTRC